MTNPKFVKACLDLAEFTSAVCKSSCDNLGSCCSTEYCDMAIVSGLLDGVEYEKTGNKLPMFDDLNKVCIAAPHHRLLCTAHHCEIASVGVLKNKPKETDTYFMLREEVESSYIERNK